MDPGDVSTEKQPSNALDMDDEHPWPQPMDTPLPDSPPHTNRPNDDTVTKLLYQQQQQEFE
eukprot:Ihof_evm1s1448 gene=Ihof_evmTU1s1448